MKARTTLAILPLLLVLPGPGLRADRGSIPFRPDVRIFEPNQRALISWNGKEEILILSTDLRASEDVEVLEVLPLPSEPKVEKGSLESIRRANEIINRKLREKELSRRSTFGERGGPKAAAGEVTFHKKIGPHEIDVTRVKDRDGFSEWVVKYLQKRGVPSPTISPRFLKLIDAYLKDGFRWFVFDVIRLERTTRTIEPIEYRFRSSALYYPLRITTLEEGETTIDLVIITPKLLGKFPGLPMKRVELRHEPFEISREEVRWIDKDLADLLGQADRPYLRIWRCKGPLASFDKDLLAME